jgi:DNA polymerase V
VENIVRLLLLVTRLLCWIYGQYWCQLCAPQLLAAAPLVLPMPDARVRAGFPSPAEDFTVNRLDLTQILVTHSQPTYLLRVAGPSMREADIDDGDTLVVDRAIKPRHGNVVVAVVDGECTVKYLHRRAGRVKLKAANSTFPDIVPKDGQTVEVWGVVTSCIKRFAACRFFSDAKEAAMYALVDGSNFYASCERVFRPSLNGRPVVVLSNNDGCAIARSNEAKGLGIRMGAPWFQIRHLECSAGLVALSANFTLYGDMSDRMMSLAAGLGPTHPGDLLDRRELCRSARGQG